MLDARYVADHLEETRTALERRSAAAAHTLDGVAEILARRRALIQSTEQLQARRNAANQEMAALAKGGDRALFEARRDELKRLTAETKVLEDQAKHVDAEVEQHLLGVPNVPHPSVPDGGGEADNPVRRVWGTPPALDF